MKILIFYAAILIAVLGVFFSNIPILPIILEALAAIVFSMNFEKGKWLYLILFFSVFILIITNYMPSFEFLLTIK
ncbi:hypothetical protein SAMN02745164_01182 [Marinitoga hydrogenitolerans DSM 16785]|uniref:Uncharacterized protein n=1 Tax=Marinitoga hydrogenitolerans (strain DSM 16785 / JCM 12826 / AT1271) TaxID=1122195 RepID=A0A1M4WI26_MARH1|nr:hypothetical protein [Marinitoga hydrogenitolerans]SHE80888.1 hypothetical protein SAMN02745164_01182 [Marinitoga hydrogenitolerans DSM 16785]